MERHETAAKVDIKVIMETALTDLVGVSRPTMIITLLAFCATFGHEVSRVSGKSPYLRG